MPNIQVKGVPADVHLILVQRAATAHQSLQEYLLGVLSEIARQPTLDEILVRAGRRTGGSAPKDVVVDTLRRDRASH